MLVDLQERKDVHGSYAPQLLFLTLKCLLANATLTSHEVLGVSANDDWDQMYGLGTITR